MAKLNDVFGISAKVPTYTYVDRAGLDSRLQYLLTADRHIVIYGPSKQGKTSLRRKVLPDNQTVVIHCRLDMTVEHIYGAILAALGVEIPTERSVSTKFGAKADGGVGGEARIPFVAKGTVKSKIELNGERAVETTSEPAGKAADDLAWIADQIRNSRKHLVIEDFHYLNETEKKRFAFDLKTLWDLGVFVITVGIWAEQNLLVYYNGDLTGRIEELDLVWTDDELLKVIELGEEALGILVEGGLKKTMVQDAVQNIGLLQRLAERLCFESGILETRYDAPVITEATYLDQAREQVCREESQRYRQFCEAVVRGYKGYEESELKVYEHIVRVCVEAPDDELRAGLDRDVILKRVRSAEPRVRLSDLSAALNRIDRLQADRSISPLVLTYNSESRRVFLADRELLFYRRYGSPTWPWQDGKANG